MGKRVPWDGLEALRKQLDLSTIMGLIERTARWVDPDTFKLLPLWYPEYARRSYYFKTDWHEPQMNKNRQTGLSVHKQEGNRYANMALTHALGLRSDDRPNWSCCHIWGIDDAFFQKANAGVQDRRFFSCGANMVLLPTPLKAVTDVMADVKAMLRLCALNLYGWYCDHDSVQDVYTALQAWNGWDAYPKSWPRTPSACLPLGVVPIDQGIRKSVSGRLTQIRRDLASAGPHYPRDEVKAALTYWHIEI